MKKQATKASKLEKRLGVTLGGYQARSQALATRLLIAHEDLQSSELELASFKNLRIMEETAVGTRLEALNKEVAHLSSRESFLQQKWDGLNREREDVTERIKKLQEQQQGKTAENSTEAEASAPVSDDDDEDVGPQPMQE
jgi:pre-mRNA-splicing factor CDC5/CEF1